MMPWGGSWGPADQDPLLFGFPLVLIWCALFSPPFLSSSPSALLTLVILPFMQYSTYYTTPRHTTTWHAANLWGRWRSAWSRYFWASLRAQARPSLKSTSLLARLHCRSHYATHFAQTHCSLQTDKSPPLPRFLRLQRRPASRRLDQRASILLHRPSIIFW